MTDKLISKESLLKDLDSVIAQYNWVEDGVIMDILDCVRDMVCDQPTAYDIDEIIEQLGKLEKEHPYRVIGQPNTYNLYNEGWQDCIDRVLGIVKSGDESRENMQESTNTSERILVGERLPDKIWEQLKSLRMGEGEQK